MTQVQNVVGGGSLYGIADAQQASLGRASSLEEGDVQSEDEEGEVSVVIAVCDSN